MNPLFPRLILVCLPAIAPVWVGADGSAAAERYREAMALAGGLPSDREEFVSSATRESVGQLEQALELARENLGAESVDWGIDWERVGHLGLDFEAPGQMRNLVRLGVTYHGEKLKRGDHGSFAPDMAALLRAGRGFAEGQLLIHQLTTMATEGIVVAEVARHAVGLPPEKREELLQLWRATPEGPSMAATAENKAAALRGEMWNIFSGNIDKERLSGLIPEELLQPAGGHPGLRISSIVVLGGEVDSVGFEEIESGGSFNLRPGETRRGVKLVSVEVSAGRAWVRRGEETLLVELEDRAIAPIDLELAWERLKAVMGLDDHAEPEYFDRVLKEAGGDIQAAFATLLDTVRADYQSILPLLRMPYDQIRRMEAGEFAERIPEEPSPLTRSAITTLLRTHGHHMQSQAREALLLAGLERLNDPAAPLPDCPVTGEPLQARYEGDTLVLLSTFPDQRRHFEGPLTMEFPSPSSGRE